MKAATDVTPEYFDRSGAARYLSLSTSWVDKAKKDGRLPYIKMSNRLLLFKKSDLDDFLAEFRVDPGEPSPFENPSRRRGKNGKFSKQKGGRA